MDKQFWLAGLIRFLIYFCHWMVLAHIPVVFSGYGLSNIQIGLLIGLFSLSSMILMIPMGLFSDRFSPKKILLMGCCAQLIYYCLLGSVSSFHTLLIAMVVGGFGASALIVVSEALFLKRYGQGDQNRRIGYYQGTTYLGFGLGPLCGGFILQGYSALFLFVLAGLFTLGLFFSCTGLRDSSVIRFSLSHYRADFKDTRSLLLLTAIIVIGFHFGVEQVSTALIMKEDLGLNSAEIGQIFCILGVWMGLLVPWLAKIKNKSPKLFVYLLGGIAISGLFQSLTAYAMDYWSFALIRGLHTFGDCLALLELSVLIALLFPATRLGGNSGFLYGIRTLSAFLAAVLAGIFNEAYGFQITFILSGILMVGFGVTGLLWIGSSKALRAELHWH